MRRCPDCGARSHSRDMCPYCGAEFWGTVQQNHWLGGVFRLGFGAIGLGLVICFLVAVSVVWTTARHPEGPSDVRSRNSSEDPHLRSAIGYLQRSQCTTALLELQAAPPHSGLTHDLRGLALYMQNVNDPSAAVGSEFRQALNCDPELANAHLHLAVFLAQTGDLARAREEGKMANRCVHLMYPGSGPTPDFYRSASEVLLRRIQNGQPVRPFFADKAMSNAPSGAFYVPISY